VAAVAITTTPANAAVASVERLRQRIANDRVLQEFTDNRKLAVGTARLTPSGVDLAACALAGTVLRTEDCSIALAIPRGQHGLAVIVGAYLGRLQEERHRPGSVAVLTRSPALRYAGASLVVPNGSFGDRLSVRKLGTLPVRDGRVRAAAVSYAASQKRRGISQADHHLLFQLPHVAPPLAHNVISTAVVDAASSSRQSWEQSCERNRRARRRQVWIGELGDADFSAFCDEQQIPLFSFDWETIAACTATFGCGNGPLTTASLCAAAASGHLGPAFQVCNHARFNEELKELHWRLAEMRKRARHEPGEAKPAPFVAAERLAAFLGRAAFPVEAFDTQTAFTYGVRSSSRLLRQVEDAYPAAFRGRDWKDAFNLHWGAVKGAARALREIASGECPKWWAVCFRVEAAHHAGERLRIVCQTQADQAALAQSLVDERVVTPVEIGELVDIVTYSQRDELGDDNDERVTLYLAPPPPWRAAAYLSGERGRVEVLVYPTQVWPLRQAFARTWTTATNHVANAALLNWIGFDGSEIAPAASEPPALRELEQFTLDDTSTGEDDYTLGDSHEHVRTLLAEIISLDGSAVDDDGAEPERGERTTIRTLAAGRVAARRLVFEEGPTLLVGADARLDVVWTAGEKAQAKVRETPVAELRPGCRVIVLPGSKRGSLLEDLMEAWDQRLGPVRFLYQNMWQQAIEAAVAKLGRHGLAAHLGVTVQTVDDWVDPLRGSMWPQQKRWMREILHLCGDANVWENRARIIRYVERTRGMHRLIGRLLNRAVTEAVAGDSARWTRELERRIGQTLEDELAAAQFLTVRELGEVEQVEARRIGLFVDPDDATTKGSV
jgi:hypothetical protein